MIFDHPKFIGETDILRSIERMEADVEHSIQTNTCPPPEWFDRLRSLFKALQLP